MKAEESSIPAGRHFLPGTTAESMRAKHLEEADSKAAERLLAYIMRKKGMSIRQICAALNRPYSTIRDWLVRAVQAGVGGRYDIVIPGTEGRLDGKQLGQLKADLVAGPQSCGSGSGTWTARLVAEHVRRRFGVQYRTVSMYDILHRLGFSWRKPRPKHPKSASESAKRAFKKKARRIMRDNPGHTVTAVDAASHIIGRDARSSWYPRGRPAAAPVTLSRKRFHSFGALVDGGFECRLYDRANGDSFIDLPGRLRHKYGKLIVVLDNAGYHKSKKVAEFVGSCNGDIIPVYLPPYTPELNPIETQWRMVRKATANRLYDTTKSMKDSIWAMLASGELGVAKMSGYLT